MSGAETSNQDGLVWPESRGQQEEGRGTKKGPGVCSYRAGDHADIAGTLPQPVVHILADSKEIVEAGGLSGGPTAL